MCGHLLRSHYYSGLLCRAAASGWNFMNSPEDAADTWTKKHTRAPLELTQPQFRSISVQKCTQKQDACQFAWRLPKAKVAICLRCFSSFFFPRQPAQEHSCTFSTARAPWQGNQWLSQPRTSPARTPLIHQDMLKVITSDIAPLLHTFSQSWSTAHARAK